MVEGAIENSATVQALLDNLIERGIDPAVPRLFIVDGAKALSKAIQTTFGKTIAIQRCQIHKARNIMDRLPKELHASTRRVLRQAWELDDAQKAEKLIRNLARRLEQDRPGVAASILEGLDEILTVVRLKLPIELRRSLACTNIAENMMGTIRRVTRNVKRASAEDWLGRWAMNLMLINVSTRRFGRAVRLPEGDVPAGPGSGMSKSAASRHFVALSAEKLGAFMSADLSVLDLLVIQIDGLHVSNDLVLVAAIGIDGDGGKHPLAVVEGATENAATVQALLDNLVERGIDPAVSRLYIVDGAKVLSKAIRATLGLSGIPCVDGHNGIEGDRPWPAAKNPVFLTRCSTSFCRAPIRRPPSTQAVFSMA